MSVPGSEESGGNDLPRQIGPYRILRHLGAGGMGEVYLAERVEPRQLVAVKVIKLGMDSASVLSRFEIERQALALMDHGNIARMFDAGTTERGQPYFAMEYVPGVPITEYCSRRKLGLEPRLRLFLRVCDGVHHAHQKGVIHRDLKPGNILVMEQDDRPVPKIIDFGLARAVDQTRLRTGLTQLGRFVGTLPYISPEQANPDVFDVDTRTDVYSLGVVLYELLTGEPPFSGDALERAGYLETLRIIREEDPPTPSEKLSSGSLIVKAHADLLGVDTSSLCRRVKGDLDAIALCTLEKDRNRRYRSVSELAANLERHLRSEPVQPAPPGASYRVRKWVRRNRRGVTIAGAVAIVILTLAGTWIWKQLETQAAQWETILTADPLVLRELTRREREDLWPATEERIPAMERWLAEAHDLLGRLPEHRRLGAGSRNRGPALEPTFVIDAERLAAETVPLVERRLERARTTTERSVDRHADAWQRAVDAVRADPPYRVPDFVPQPGLVPLGPSAQGLQEFYLLDSGEPPVSKPEGGFAVGPDTAVVLVLIPGGSFTMGAQKDDPNGRNYDPGVTDGSQPPIGVELDPFFLGKYELTQGQWIRLAEVGIDENPANNRGNDGDRDALVRPVELVSWWESEELLRHWRLTLPTSARWEYACRAGEDSVWHTGSTPDTLEHHANILDASAIRAGYVFDEIAAGFDDGFVFTAPAGTFAPNGFGLHDMHGNVWEWCLDGYVRDYTNGVEAGHGLLRGSTGTGRGIYRGGGFLSAPRHARSACWRQAVKPNLLEDVGVRAAMDVRLASPDSNR